MQELSYKQQRAGPDFQSLLPGHLIDIDLFSMPIISIVQDITGFLIYFYRFHCANVSSSTSTRSVKHFIRYFLCPPKDRAILFSSRNVFPDCTRYTGAHPEKAVEYIQCLSLCGKGLAHTLPET